MYRREHLPKRRISTLTGHNGAVHAVTYSAGFGQYILTGCSDREIRLFNPASGPTATPIQKYSTHAYAVLDLAVSADNARFASVGQDKTVFLWDVASAQTLRRWSGHSARIEAVAMGGLGDEVVVSGSYDQTTRLWDAKSNAYKPIMTLSDARDSVSSVAISGPNLLTSSVDGCVRRYDLRMGKLFTDLIGYPVTSLAPTKNTDSYLTSTLDSKLRLMDSRDGKLLQKFSDPSYTNTTYRTRSTLLQGDGLIIAGSETGNAVAWDLLSGVCVGSVRHSLDDDHKNELPVPTTGSGGGGGGGGSGTALEAHGGGQKEGWRATGMKKSSVGKAKMGGARGVVSAVAACPARREWCSAGGDGTVAVWSD